MRQWRGAQAAGRTRGPPTQAFSLPRKVSGASKQEKKKIKKNFKKSRRVFGGGRPYNQPLEKGQVGIWVQVFHAKTRGTTFFF
jgi:hypothetical protein